METAVPREIVDARGGLEKDHRRARGFWLLTSYSPRHRRDFEIIEPADQSAFDTLSVEFSEHGNRDSLFVFRGFKRIYIVRWETFTNRMIGTGFILPLFASLEITNITVDKLCELFAILF